MTKDEALKMAIEALSQDEGWFEPEKAIQACKEALEQPSQNIELEWYNKGWTDAIWEFEWLSDDEIGDLITHYEYSVHPDLDGFARAIEQALKEKNNAVQSKL